LVGGEIHPQVFGQSGVVDRPSAGGVARLKHVDLEPTPALDVARLVE
jgi:hypothetical protein